MIFVQIWEGAHDKGLLEGKSRLSGKKGVSKAHKMTDEVNDCFVT
jgi:hypothetical protein